MKERVTKPNGHFRTQVPAGCVFGNMAIIGAAVLAASLPFFSSSALTDDESRIARVFNPPIRVIIIENLEGTTEVATWPAATVGVTATQANNADRARIDSDVIFEQPTADVLRIATKPTAADNPIDLSVFVPASVQVYVKGGGKRVTIKGLGGGVSIETDSGPVAIHLPEKSDTALSLRTIQGIIDS